MTLKKLHSYVIFVSTNDMKITTLKTSDNSEISILAYSIQFISYVLSPEKVHCSLKS